NLADVALLVASFPAARDYSGSALSLITDADKSMTANALAYRASAHFHLGEIDEAFRDFRRGTDVEQRSLYSIDGIWEAECKLFRGNRSGALSQTQANREMSIKYSW